MPFSNIDIDLGQVPGRETTPSIDSALPWLVDNALRERRLIAFQPRGTAFQQNLRLGGNSLNPPYFRPNFLSQSLGGFSLRAVHD
jgi:hypothetical protein